MKCKGCDDGLPVISGTMGPTHGPHSEVAWHYTPGAEHPASRCTKNDVDCPHEQVWEGEGGRLAA